MRHVPVLPRKIYTTHEKTLLRKYSTLGVKQNTEVEKNTLTHYSMTNNMKLGTQSHSIGSVCQRMLCWVDQLNGAGLRTRRQHCYAMIPSRRIK